MDLSNFGKKFNIKKNTKNEKTYTEVDIFTNIVSTLEKCWAKSNNVYNIFRVNLLEYEEDYFQVIENLLLIKYGDWKTEIILWYIYGRKDIKGNPQPLILQTDNEEPIPVMLTTPLELWKFLEDFKEK
jgi:hypothetical protein